MAITVGNGNYSAYTNYAQNAKKASEENRTSTAAARQTESTKNTAVKLSEKAQALLERLKKTYSNMDFMVADYENSEDAKDILSRGTKEYSVLFSSEELEKMASDEKNEKEYLEKMEGAVRMSEQINRQYGYTSALGQNAGESTVSRIGIAFNKDGTTSYFAELEKTTQKQKERIENKREARAKEQKEAARKERQEDASAKRVTLWAASPEELLESMKAVDWSQVKEETAENEGRKIDFRA